jgi:tRNA (mo5U34)-methyltransferase
MATKRLNIMGLWATLFASGNRAGLEFSVPIGALRKGSSGVVPVPPPQPPISPEVSADADAVALARRVDAITWYHTIELRPGIVTPGFYDHRPILERYRLPDRLDGMRVLDIATFDGFWSYEFERRGAAEVVALDIRTARELDLPWRLRESMSEADLDRPFGEGFRLAHSVLGSRVKHVHCNVYDLGPEKLGVFDLVHCGDLLLHLRDPARALYNMRRVTRGEAIISDCIYPDMDRHDGAPIVQYDGGHSENIWWRFGASALRAMIADAGFDRVEEVTRFRYGPRGHPPAMWHAIYRGRGNAV